MRKSLFLFFIFYSFFFFHQYVFVYSQEEIIPNLFITEVFYDGSSERIEVANISQEDFSGTISFATKDGKLRETPLFFLSGGGVFVFHHKNFVFFSGEFQKGEDTLWQKFGDTAAIDLSIFLSSSLLDSFFVGTADVALYNDKKTSFHRVFSNEDWSILPSTLLHKKNIQDGYIANPGVVWSEEKEIFPFYKEPSLPISCNGNILIEEVYKGTGTANSYIEFLFFSGVGGEIILSGSSLQTPVVVEIPLFPLGTRFLVTPESISDSFVFSLPFSFLDSGTLEIWFEGEVQDRINLSFFPPGGAMYGENTSCSREFSKVGLQTPLLPSSFASFFSNQTVIIEKEVILEKIVEKEIIITGSCQEIPPFSGGNQQSGENIQGYMSGIEVEIASLVFDPPGSDTNNEYISFRLTTGADMISLSGAILSYDTTKTFLLKTGILLLGEEFGLSGNFGFVNSRPVCVDLSFSGFQVSSLCYDPAVHVSGYVSSGEVIPPPLQQDFSAVSFTIHDVVYDPNLQGGDQESITLFLRTGADSLNMRDCRLRVNDNITRKTLSGIIFPGKPLLIPKNFGFPNTKETTIYLFCEFVGNDEKEYARFSYIPFKEEGDQKEEIHEMSYTGAKIEIMQVVYDPEGNDAGNETITFINTKGFGDVDFQYLRLRVGKSIKKIQGILPEGKEKTFKGTFGFPNTKATCIDLLQDKHIFSTYCYDPQKDKEKIKKEEQKKKENVVAKEQEIENKFFWTGTISLTGIVYDPEGNDAGNEQICFHVFSGNGYFNLADAFLQIHTTKKKLTGEIMPGQLACFFGTFGFPNTKRTCVSLLYQEKSIAESCYDPQSEEGKEKNKKGDPEKGEENGQKKEEDILSSLESSIFLSGAVFSFVSVLPNPAGADEGNEQVCLLATHNTATSFVFPPKSSIRTSTKKVSLAGREVIFGQELCLTGTFGLVNKGGRVSREVGAIEVAKMTYTVAKDGELFFAGGGSFLPDSKEKQSVKKKATQQNRLVHGDLSLAQEYIRVFEQKMRTDWLPLWQYSVFSQYAFLYRQAKEYSDQGETAVVIDGIYVPINDLVGQYALVYTISPTEKVKKHLATLVVGADVYTWWQQQQRGSEEE